LPGECQQKDEGKERTFHMEQFYFGVRRLVAAFLYGEARHERKAATIRRTRAPESASGQRGESPLQAGALRPVTDSNCDAAMRGGEQLEVNDQSVEKRTRFGQVTSASWRVNSEA